MLTKKGFLHMKKVLLLLFIFLFNMNASESSFSFDYFIKKLTTEQKIEVPTYVGLISIENDLESARTILNALLQLNADPKIKGILLHINCFGGHFGTTQAIFNEIKKIKKTKPVIVIIENYCYSCAYYLATAADFIFALPSSEVGCLGVIRTIRQYKDLKFNENGVSGTMEAIVITSGSYKGSSCRYVPLSDEHREYMQQNSIKIYKQCITDVAQARGLSLEDEKIWADGKEFVGTEALELGLIDALGGFTDALEKMKELLEQRGIKVEGNLELFEITL